MKGLVGEPVFVETTRGQWDDRVGWLLCGMCWWVVW